MIKMKRFTGRIAIRSFVVMLLCILPMNVFVFFLNRHVMKRMEEEIKVSVQSILENHVNMLENRIGVGSNLLWYMKYENANGITLISQTDSSRYAFYKSVFFYDLKDMIELSEGLDTYFFCVEDRDDIIIWNKSGRRLAAVQDYLQEKYKDHSMYKGWSLQKIAGEEILFLYVEQKDASYGGWIELADVRKLLEHDIQYEKEEITFTSLTGGCQEDCILVMNRSERGDFYINAYLNMDEIQDWLVASNSYTILGTVVSMFIFPFLYLFIRRTVLNPLGQLNQAFKKVEMGDLNYRMKEKADSLEFRQSFRAFNTMVEHIRKLKIDNYEKQLEKERIELLNLQLQIRPHFLLNNFNLLYVLAQKKENHVIQQNVLYLSKYFRYLFRSGNSLQLFPKEQELLEGYIKIAQIRYPDCIEIVYSYDPKILLVRVPPLLLHNFVENIVKHVVQPGRVTHIEVCGKYQEGRVTFWICDDGQGMSHEKLQELNAFMRSKQTDGAHVGFANSLRRIKYFYGDTADIMIASEEGKGTRVAITFPYNLEEKE